MNRSWHGFDTISIHLIFDEIRTHDLSIVSRVRYSLDRTFAKQTYLSISETPLPVRISIDGTAYQPNFSLEQCHKWI